MKSRVILKKIRVEIFSRLILHNLTGALPVVTRNVLERGSLSVKNIIYNQWRHNVVYKIDSTHVSLTNPLERVEESVLSRQLCQQPLIYIKRSTMMKKWHPKVDLRPLHKPVNQRWFNENVLGLFILIFIESNDTKFDCNLHLVLIFRRTTSFDDT